MHNCDFIILSRTTIFSRIGYIVMALDLPPLNILLNAKEKNVKLHLKLPKMIIERKCEILEV